MHNHNRTNGTSNEKNYDLLLVYRTCGIYRTKILRSLSPGNKRLGIGDLPGVRAARVFFLDPQHFADALQVQTKLVPPRIVSLALRTIARML